MLDQRTFFGDTSIVHGYTVMSLCKHMYKFSLWMTSGSTAPTLPTEEYKESSRSDKVDNLHSQP